MARLFCNVRVLPNNYQCWNKAYAKCMLSHPLYIQAALTSPNGSSPALTLHCSYMVSFGSKPGYGYAPLDSIWCKRRDIYILMAANPRWTRFIPIRPANYKVILNKGNTPMWGWQMRKMFLSCSCLRQTRWIARLSCFSILSIFIYPITYFPLLERLAKIFFIWPNSSPTNPNHLTMSINSPSIYKHVTILSMCDG